ncbi:MAG: hypothetical protein FKY71_06050 [Spiribacter salinus]|uniref:Toxin-antitoxin system YwqK family antitoxin n=1 Tax=Spiribacter salinus TaxID=1335746 RepID=A0A540VT41_9GAMM|nr:MAG: hypothetical protein FKY71_06050 [Spiribacter salinus]
MLRLFLVLLMGVTMFGCTRAAETYWPTGEVRERGETSFGKKTGEWVMYSGDGDVRARGRYKNDRRVGVWKFFRKDGSLEYTEEYDHSLPRSVRGLATTVGYAEDGETVTGVSTHHLIAFYRMDGDRWRVMDTGTDLHAGGPVETGVVEPAADGEGYVFKGKNGEKVALPTDYHGWAEPIRSVVPLDPSLR